MVSKSGKIFHKYSRGVYIFVPDLIPPHGGKRENPMMKIPTVRLVFDRKHVATKKKKGLIQVEVLFGGRRKWIGTGIKVYSDQWDARRWVVNSTDMYDVNDSLRQQVQTLEKWLRDNFSVREPFSWGRLEAYLRNERERGSFLDFVSGEIERRNDIRESTRRAQRKILSMVRQFGHIEYFDDLTPATIMDFDNWLHGRQVRRRGADGREILSPMKQRSIFEYHMLLKLYINKAVRRGLMAASPYAGLRLKRGDSGEGRYLTEAELGKIEGTPMPTKALSRTRDLFVFQCYTGLSYADLKSFDPGKVGKVGGVPSYAGLRQKTGEPFCFALLPQAQAVLSRYDGGLPRVPTCAPYDVALKRVAAAAGVRKPISSHWARRTAAVMLANRRVPYEVIAKILGHSSVQTTAAFYARISDETVVRAMRDAGLQPPGLMNG